MLYKYKINRVELMAGVVTNSIVVQLSRQKSKLFIMN